mmetsp:Transcript_81335/g.143520  ORF Transcript_81335/g.143520 Transcript_81335/m.143520 type:complete len:304 (+) Transcript_81335:46-957(+)
MGNGSSVSWTPDADSLSQHGKKSILSSDIELEGLTVQKLMNAYEQKLRKRDKVEPETAYECRQLPDGGVVGASTYPLDDGVFKTYTTFYFKKATDEIICNYHETDETCSASSKVQTRYLKIHSDPAIRLEFWCEELAVRRADGLQGLFLKGNLAGIGAPDTKIAIGVESPLGGKCVLSDPIVGATVDAAGFLDWFRSQAVDERGCEEDTDGSLKEVLGGWFSGSLYVRHVLDKSKQEIRSMDYGDDADWSESSITMTTYIKVHDKPFRLEMFAEPVPGRYSSQRQVPWVEPITNQVLQELMES